MPGVSNKPSTLCSSPLADITLRAGNSRQTTLLWAFDRSDRPAKRKAQRERVLTEGEGCLRNTPTASYGNDSSKTRKRQRLEIVTRDGISGDSDSENNASLIAGSLATAMTPKDDADLLADSSDGVCSSPAVQAPIPRQRSAMIGKYAYIRRRQHFPAQLASTFTYTDILGSYVSDTKSVYANTMLQASLSDEELDNDNQDQQRQRQQQQQQHSQRAIPLAGKYTNRPDPRSRFVVTDESGTTQLFEQDGDDGRITRVCKWQVHDNAVFDVTFSLDDSRVFTASADETCALWDLAAQQQVGLFTGATKTMRTVCTHPAEPNVFVGASRDDKILIWDIRCNGTPVGRLGHWAAYRPVDVIANSHGPGLGILPSLAAGDHRPVRSLSRRARLARPLNVSVTGIAVLPQQPWLMASSCSFDGQVRLWDIRKYGVYSGGAGRTPAPVAMSAIAGNRGASRSRGVSSLAIDSLGTRIYVACGDNKVRVYNALRLGEPLATMTSPEFECNGFFVRTAVSPDDRFLAVGSSTGAVNVWELEPSKGIPMIARDAPLDLSKADVVLENAHTKEASCVAWRPTLAPDYQLLTCSDDGTIRTWNPRPRACAGCSLDEISAIYPDAKSQWGFARRS